MKKLLLLTAALLLSLPAARGADLQKGFTFTDGQRIYASQLASLVDAAIILPAFYTGKTAESVLDPTDTLLVYSTLLSGYRRITATDALYGNTTLITGRTDKAAPVAGDYLLLYDSVGVALKKASVQNLLLGNTNLIWSQPETTSTNLSATESYLALLNYGTNARTSLSNFFQADPYRYKVAFTNLAAHTAPTNQDQLLIWDSSALTNRTITLSSLVTNLPALLWATNSVTNWFQLTNTDSFAINSTINDTNNGTADVLSKATLAQLAFWLSNSVIWPSQTNTTYVSATNTIPYPATAWTNTISFATNPSAVRWVILNNQTDLGYLPGDEVEINNLIPSAGGNVIFSFWANPTNLGIVRSTVDKIQIRQRVATIGTLNDINTNKWVLKVYARP